jgi:pectate disaccharide-lyase
MLKKWTMAFMMLAGTGVAVADTYTSALHLLPYAAKTNASVYYAAANGSSTAAGTLAAPFDLETGLAKLGAGDTLYVRGGTYTRSATLTIDNSKGNATSGHTHVFAYQSEKPVLDFTSQTTGDAARGIQLNGSYWYVKGLRIKGAGDNGMLITGNYNLVEQCVFQGNRDTGLQIARKSSSLTTMDQWPKYNLIKNCESYDNSDATGENADGFAAKLTIGEGNAFVGCNSHNNSDDGWDLYTKVESGAIGTVTLDRCVAHHNGTLTDGTILTAGDRNGFKLGGEKIAVRHIVTRSVAFANGKNGFTWNSNPGNIIMANNLAFDNAQGNYKFGDNSTATTTEYYNNISLWTSLSADVADKYIGTDYANSNVWWNSAKSAGATSINAIGLQGYTDDFTTDLTTLTNVNRTSNGDLDFSVFALASGSDLINAGTVPNTLVPFTVAAAYVGNPDLGPVEAGLPGTDPTSSSSSATASSSSSSAALTSSSATNTSSSSSATTALQNPSSLATSVHYDAARGLLFSPVSGRAVVQVLDMQGARVQSFTMAVQAGSNNIQLAPAASGLYLVRISMVGLPLAHSSIIKR